MFEYKFERIKLTSTLFATTLEPEQDYAEVVHLRAKEGWRFVQAFSPALAGKGHATYIDLIFERSS